ncbi:MAG TPA: NAD-dependent epimerase/dehydratase family protein [Candidatus Paceibacterota bacterium]|jgi:nucleoside-diphosphate-sugar epimerase|nr:NAD-dependent epimerase/dehydratase family protein [Candidatus Paceibacterota bacterium]
MKILITGGAGLVGSNLSKRLLDEGHSVFVVDNFTTGSEENVKSLQGYENYSFCECGIESPDFIKFCEKVGCDFDRIYHLACPTGVPNIDILAEEMLISCSIGTLNVLRIAEKSKARLLFTSSSEVYGEPEKTPQDEKYTGNVETTGPRANYEEGKRFSETLVAHFVKKYGLHAVTVRLFNAYGPNMSLKDQRVLPRFIQQALRGDGLTVQGEGSQTRTLCFVSDILDGFEAVISKGTPGEIYNLGSDSAITIRELAEFVIAAVGSESEIVSVPRPEHDHSSRMPVLEKIRSLGWRQKVDLKLGLQKMIENFKLRLEYPVVHNVDTAPQQRLSLQE